MWITSSISHTNNANKTFDGIHCHQRKYQQLHRNQGLSKACGDIKKPHWQKRGERVSEMSTFLNIAIPDEHNTLLSKCYWDEDILNGDKIP